MRSRNLAIAIVVLLATMLLTTPAQAGKAETEIGPVDAEIHTGSSAATYSGKVKSSKRCRKWRRVTLVHDSDPPFTIGETTTDKNGRWEISGPYPLDSSDDRIIVKVSSTERCKGATGYFNFYDES